MLALKARHDARRRPRRELAHGGARGLGRGRGRAVPRRPACMRAGTLEELVDAAALLSSQPLPRGRRVARGDQRRAVSESSAQTRATAGLELPELSEETRAALRACCQRRQCRQPGRPPRLGDRRDLRGRHPSAARGHARRRLDRSVRPSCRRWSRGGRRRDRATPSRRTRTDKPVLAVLISAGTEPRRCCATAIALSPRSPIRSRPRARSASQRSARNGYGVLRARFLLPSRVDTPRRASLVEAALDGRDETWLDAGATRDLLTAYGIPVVPERLAQSADAAVEAAPNSASRSS